MAKEIVFIFTTLLYFIVFYIANKDKNVMNRRLSCVKMYNNMNIRE